MASLTRSAESRELVSYIGPWEEESGRLSISNLERSINLEALRRRWQDSRERAAAAIIARHDGTKEDWQCAHDAKHRPE